MSNWSASIKQPPYSQSNMARRGAQSTSSGLKMNPQEEVRGRTRPNTIQPNDVHTFADKYRQLSQQLSDKGQNQKPVVPPLQLNRVTNDNQYQPNDDAYKNRDDGYSLAESQRSYRNAPQHPFDTVSVASTDRITYVYNNKVQQQRKFKPSVWSEYIQPMFKACGIKRLYTPEEEEELASYRKMIHEEPPLKRQRYQQEPEKSPNYGDNIHIDDQKEIDPTTLRQLSQRVIQQKQEIAALKIINEQIKEKERLANQIKANDFKVPLPVVRDTIQNVGQKQPNGYTNLVNSLVNQKPMPSQRLQEPQQSLLSVRNNLETVSQSSMRPRPVAFAQDLATHSIYRPPVIVQPTPEIIPVYHQPPVPVHTYDASDLIHMAETHRVPLPTHHHPVAEIHKIETPTVHQPVHQPVHHHVAPQPIHHHVVEKHAKELQPVPLPIQHHAPKVVHTPVHQQIHHHVPKVHTVVKPPVHQPIHHHVAEIHTPEKQPVPLPIHHPEPQTHTVVQVEKPRVPVHHPTTEIPEKEQDNLETVSAIPNKFITQQTLSTLIKHVQEYQPEEQPNLHVTNHTEELQEVKHVPEPVVSHSHHPHPVQHDWQVVHKPTQEISLAKFHQHEIRHDENSNEDPMEVTFVHQPVQPSVQYAPVLQTHHNIELLETEDQKRARLEKEHSRLQHKVHETPLTKKPDLIEPHEELLEVPKHHQPALRKAWPQKVVHHHTDHAKAEVDFVELSHHQTPVVHAHHHTDRVKPENDFLELKHHQNQVVYQPLHHQTPVQSKIQPFSQSQSSTSKKHVPTSIPVQMQFFDYKSDNEQSDEQEKYQEVIAKPAIQQTSQNPFLKAIQQENLQIVHNQQPLEQAKPRVRFNFDETVVVQDAKNLNYTGVPENSQDNISMDDLDQNDNDWKGTISKQPDSDTIEDLNMPEINTEVLKALFDKNKDVVQLLNSNDYLPLMKLMSSRMRSILGFMQKEVRVYSQDDISSEEAWKNFVDNESLQISKGKYKAIVLLLNIGSQIDFVMITKEKMCTIHFTTEQNARRQEQLADKTSKIHQMLNGIQFAKEKKLFGFTQDDNDSQINNSNIDVKQPEQANETIIVKSNPLFAVYAYYRYYVLQEKLMAIVKFNLDHQAYFSKRNEIMAVVNDAELRDYWNAALFSFICV